jgi:DNA-binding transcriptional LysR family regulator
LHSVTFDLEVLRTFVAGVELGSFALAARKLGRSRSALSAQLRRLEEQAGAAVFRKSGRGLALTPVGETLLAYARRLLELDDEAAIAVRGVEVEGWVRLGTQEDLGAGLLPDVLRRFARAHPKVRIEARVARNAELLERVKAASLDLALVWGDGSAAPNGERLAQLSMCWIGLGERARVSPSSPLPLAVVESPCQFRDAAIAALDRARIPWRLSFTSASLGGVWAAARAGIGLTVRTALGQPPEVRALGQGPLGLPALPSLGLSLHRAERLPGPAVRLLAALVSEAVHEALAVLPESNIGAPQPQAESQRKGKVAAKGSARPPPRA